MRHHFAHNEFVFLNPVFEGGSQSVWPEFWGGFAGAFFAFVFGLITYLITKRRERFVQHKNALVKLEQLLNKHLNDLGVLEYISSNQPQLATGQPTSNRLFHLKLLPELALELGSIRLMNKLFTYELSVDRLNFNVDTINHSLTRIEDLFIGGQIPHIENFNRVRDSFESLVKDLKRVNERTIKLLLLTRIHIRKVKEKDNFFYGVLKDIWEQDISDEEINNEREALTKEVETIIKADGKDF